MRSSRLAWLLTTLPLGTGCINTHVELRPRPVTTEHVVLPRGRVLTARLVARGRETQVCVESHAQCRDIEVIYVDRFEVKTATTHASGARERWMGAFGKTQRETSRLCDARPAAALHVEVHDDAGFVEAPTDDHGCAVLRAVARGIKFVTTNGERVTIVAPGPLSQATGSSPFWTPHAATWRGATWLPQTSDGSTKPGEPERRRNHGRWGLAQDPPLRCPLVDHRPRRVYLVHGVEH